MCAMLILPPADEHALAMASKFAKVMYVDTTMHVSLLYVAHTLHTYLDETAVYAYIHE